MVDKASVREHMEVIGSCGQQVGFVDRVEQASIKLTRDSVGARGEHRYIPLEWVTRIDDHVHLSKPCGDVRQEWTAHPVEEVGA